MYTLYFSPGTCSLATQVILRELNVPFQLVNRHSVENYFYINPLGAVPALGVEGNIITEGAAIILHLLKRHPNDLLPNDPRAKDKAVQQLMFANASVHPAYSKLFFITRALGDEHKQAKQQALQTAADDINKAWAHVEKTLEEQPYIAGDQLTPADILLSVYETWGQYFDVAIEIGPKTQALVDQVRARASFVASIAAEQEAA
ncbi:glutathione S-transferase family protein [Pseudoalteromonas sp. SS15]|uniref:glutathione S-transferase family protein n=1 Tax=Pseudoalteromonas sp. SS15 TaxID=3139393 RepID=UPI003BA88B17